MSEEDKKEDSEKKHDRESRKRRSGSRSRRSRSRSRERERRRRSRDRRSRSRSSRRRSRRHRSRSGEREDRRRSRSPRKRETSEERREREKKKKMEELTRDGKNVSLCISLAKKKMFVISHKKYFYTSTVRTVFVGQLQVRATEKDIKRFFKKVGKVKVNDVQVRFSLSLSLSPLFIFHNDDKKV
jgi:RNA-binding protein 23/39